MKKIIINLLFIFSFSFIFAEQIFFSADSMSGQAGNSNSTTNLIGDAFVQTETMKIQADSIELSGENYRLIKAEGNVSGQNFSSNMDFTCDSLSYDRTTKIATLYGNVDLKDNDNDVVAKAQIIEYNQDTDIATLQIKIDLTQKDNKCTGSYAIYFKEKQLLELSGNAQIKQKDDTFRAQHISLNMNTQEITLDGNVRGSITETKNSEDSQSDESQNQNETTAKTTTVEKFSENSSEQNSSENEEKSESSEAENKNQQNENGETQNE